MKRRPSSLPAVVIGVASYLLIARPRLLRWGTTGDELDAALVGDELIARADLSSTRAITIFAPTERVWPWIAQLGQGRGGFYSYDVLENLVGCDIQSADRIVAEWQNVRAGDEVRLAPEVGLAVAVVEPERSLVLHGGIEMGKTAPPFDFTWSFTLRPLPDETTRLIVRERYAYTKPWARLVVEPTQVLSFVMSRKMLRGIKDRAENTAGQSRDRHVQDVGGSSSSEVIVSRQ